jgi:nitroimidazol reductase NimA-like FMN-containing flavoprotein (pyridoxamine 5'-phosphate oxidase superfamily)
LAQTHDHERVSIYPFSDDEIDQLMNNSNECVLMWATKDGWPVGVTHAFVWHEGKIWLTFGAHRHRAAAIRRDPRVSVTVSSAGYPPRSAKELPRGAITVKGRGEFFDDDETKAWFYPALSEKLSPTNPDAAKFFTGFLDSPLRTILAISPVKKIMYNATNADRHVAGTISEEELGAPLDSDKVRLNAERLRRGLDPL